jgi:hypothetical protein
LEATDEVIAVDFVPLSLKALPLLEFEEGILKYKPALGCIGFRRSAVNYLSLMSAMESVEGTKLRYGCGKRDWEGPISQVIFVAKFNRTTP